jgi:DNA-binding NarL/FixJ family response regulator
MPSCLVCDDHALMREALVGTVRMAWPDTRIVEAETFHEAWAKAAQQPDFILADLAMPGADPLDGIDGLMKAAPAARLLVITASQDDQMMLDLLRRGVAGFAPKAATSAIIEAALHLVAAGGTYLPPRLADLATGIASLRREAQAGGSGGTESSVQLTARQHNILRLLTLGKSNKEIARSLDLAPSTVKSHVSQILSRLSAANRTEALSKAQALNLL